jgi:putative hydrolase of the HAD superfamily
MLANKTKTGTDIRAVLFDFGGVISSSPFESFERLEVERNLPPGFIRTVNATNPDTNAWAQLERSEIDIDAFVALWSAEAQALGHEVDAREVLARLAGQIRSEMVAAIATCRTAGLKTACLTNNFGALDAAQSPEVLAVYELFDAILESRVLGFRKPDLRFYEKACEALGVAPPEAVFLDDLGINLKPARVMGMHTIKVVDPGQALKELSDITGLSFN